MGDNSAQRSQRALIIIPLKLQSRQFKSKKHQSQKYYWIIYIWYLFKFFIRYFLYLHFKCYLLSSFPLQKSPIPSSLPLLTNSPTPASLSWHFHTLGHEAFTGPLLPLMSIKAILCYICGWSHGSLQVYCLVGGLVPGRSGGTGWFILLFLLWGCKGLQLLGSFLLAPPLVLYKFLWMSSTVISPTCGPSRKSQRFSSYGENIHQFPQTSDQELLL